MEPVVFQFYKEQCYDELCLIFEDCSEREILHSDVGLMNLLERVIKETLRLRPPNFMIKRTLEDEIILGQFSYWFI
jgi:cytochrome P450